ncbi:uncharacterized protein [Musca autumnalis]|uniref:uncharacterized protein n=1 Tax=Musca autumnalis TaxID=221902 RepID=UPI003CFB7661
MARNTEILQETKNVKNDPTEFMVLGSNDQINQNIMNSSNFKEPENEGVVLSSNNQVNPIAIDPLNFEEAENEDVALCLNDQMNTSEIDPLLCESSENELVALESNVQINPSAVDPFIFEGIENEMLGFEDVQREPVEDVGQLQGDALEKMAGYVIWKLNLNEYEDHEKTGSWVDQISLGFLKKPNQEFLKYITSLEYVFASINGSKIDHNNNSQRRLLQLSNQVNLPEKVKNSFLNAECILELDI